MRILVELPSLLAESYALTLTLRQNFSPLVCNFTRDDRGVDRVGEGHMREGGPLALAQELCLFN